jgi:hypothetical protein
MLASGFSLYFINSMYVCMYRSPPQGTDVRSMANQSGRPLFVTPPGRLSERLKGVGARAEARRYKKGAEAEIPYLPH